MSVLYTLGFLVRVTGKKLEILYSLHGRVEFYILYSYIRALRLVHLKQPGGMNL